MDPLDSQCLNLRGCLGSSASAVKIAKKQKKLEVLDSGRPLVPSAKFASFPVDVSHLVGDYVSASDREYVETAFAGKQPITLCLSQDVGSKIASCWSIGFIPSNRRWEPSDVKIDKEYPIKDYKGCLKLLEQKNSDYCQFSITVLVVKLSKISRDLPMALNHLRNTTKELKEHLSSVQYVVFSIQEYASCCFTLNSAIGLANEVGQSVDNSKAIFEIIKDLKTCWRIKKRLAVHYLFAFYFKNEAKPSSDKYLKKFVIPFNTVLNRGLFKDEASKMLSTKIMWVYYSKFRNDFYRIDQNTTNLCHAIYLDLSVVKNTNEKLLAARVRDPVCFQDNRLIERIVIEFDDGDRIIKLPEPRAPLTDAMPRSALIELTLKCDFLTFDLTQLNSGYFPHLAFLSIIGGQMIGHLDSHRVPRLKLLRIELLIAYGQYESKVGHRLREHTQSLINTGRPWQLIASQDKEGWSLASYEWPIANPQDEVKEDAPSSPSSMPVIRELMLVMDKQQHADEWQSRLSGKASLKATAGNKNVGLLEWAPDCVEKITAFEILCERCRLEFKEEIPEKTRILNSLACHNMHVVVDGAALPNLRSLVLNITRAELKGKFPQLRTLSFKEGWLQSPWKLDAPMLESLSSQELIHGEKLILRPESLPRLSYLRIKPWDNYYVECPTILCQYLQGLSHVKHVVFSKGVTEVHDFDQWQVHMVSRLEMEVDALKLSCGGFKEAWQCETLNINVFLPTPERLREQEIPDIIVPLLLPKVKKLTVKEKNCQVLLDSAMPELTYCTVPSPESLGANLQCPKLKWICFTDDLSESDKVKYSNPATYLAYGAHPEMVYFDYDGIAKSLS